MADEKKKSTFWSEFKTFIARGNVMDMAVGVVVGSAFTAIVNSLVQGIINPLIGKLMGGLDLSEYKIVLTEATKRLRNAPLCTALSSSRLSTSSSSPSACSA